MRVERIVEAARDYAAPVDRQSQTRVALLLLGSNEADVRARRHRAAHAPKSVEPVDALSTVGIDPLLTADHAQERALARAVRADERPVFAGIEAPRHVFKRAGAARRG